MRSPLACVALCAALLSSCTFYDTARDWNGRVGPNGNPVFYRTATKVGFNFLILLPFVGQTDTPTMVSEITGDIKESGGDVARIVQAESENYWYGWSPLTWLISPVVSTIAVEYEPSDEEVAEWEAEKAAAAEDN